jgi:hypothetical protein
VEDRLDLITAMPPGPLFPGDYPSGYGYETLLAQWAAKVQPGGEWDYKQLDPDAILNYDDTGNFNYGATGAAMGLTLPQMLFVGDMDSATSHQEYPDQPDDISATTNGYLYYKYYYNRQ